MGNYSVIIAGGGTGGHISPGISLYEEFKDKGIRVSILLGKKDIDFFPVSKVDSKDIYVYTTLSLTKNILLMPLTIIKFMLAVFRSMMLFKKLKVDSVIGMGGYVSAPALAASVIQKIPVYLCEQNSVPGKTTSVFAAKAEKIFTTFNMTRDFLKKASRHKVIHIGNPIRRDVFTKAGRGEARKYFHLGHCKKVILVIGGSQGALEINKLFMEIKELFSYELKDIGVIWITGYFSYKKIKADLGISESDGSIYLSPFIDEIGLAYKASDLAVSRAGATGIMEFASVGLPSILIPYPNAADNHQEKNAEEFERSGASLRIRKDESDPERLGNIIMDLLSNPVQLSRMAEKAKSFARTNAAGEIVEIVSGELSTK